MEKNSTLSLASDHQSRIHTYFRMGLMEQSALLRDNRFMDELVAFLEACPCKAPLQPLRTAMSYSRALHVMHLRNGDGGVILN